MCVLPFLLAAVTPLHAQEPLEVLRKTSGIYRSARSYVLAGSDVLEQKSRARDRTTTRRFQAYRLGDSMRVDFADGGRRLTDGHTEWNYNPQTKEYSRKPVPWDSRGQRVLNEFFYNYAGIADFVKSAGFVSPPGKDGYLIEVTYELPGGVASEVIKNFWIDPSYTVRREISHPIPIVDPPAAGPIQLTRTISFDKVALNAPLDESFFSVRPPDAPAPSGPAPDFALSDLEGRQVSLRDFRGKTILLYFWATWCGTCRDEMPRLERIGREFEKRGVVLLGINDEDPAIAAAYLRDNQHTLRSLTDRWQDVFKKYAVHGIPTVVLIGKDGNIASVFGYGESTKLQAALSAP
jgi:peroxiredoxin